MINRLIKMFVKNPENVTDAATRQSYGVFCGGVGIVCNLLLFLMKMIAGLLTGAVSITADAFNNLADAGSSIVTVFGFKMAGKPADEEHPFGHGRMEYLSGLFVAVAILLMGYELFKLSIEKVFRPELIEFRWISVVILAASIGGKLLLARFYFKIGKKISSEAMKAAGTDSLSDCISTGAVLIGMLLFRVAGWNLDGCLGVIVAVMILAAGYHAVKDMIQPLLGAVPNPEMVEAVRRIALSEPKIIDIHDMVIHDYGPGRRMVSLHAEMPYHIDILEAHQVIDRVEQKLEKNLQYEATIHIDPVITDDEELKEAREMVEKIIETMNPAWKLHDFRMVRGKKSHCRLLFDLVVESKDMLHGEEIKEELQKKIREKNPDYNAVIKVEQSYT